MSAEADEAAGAASAGEADALEAAWRAVLDDWGSPDAHKRFLVLADATGRLAEAGKRYRAIRERDADEARRAEAARRIDEILSLAIVRVSAATPRGEARETRSRIEWIALGVSAVLIAAALWAMLRLT